LPPTDVIGLPRFSVPDPRLGEVVGASVRPAYGKPLTQADWHGTSTGAAKFKNTRKLWVPGRSFDPCATDKNWTAVRSARPVWKHKATNRAGEGRL